MKYAFFLIIALISLNLYGQPAEYEPYSPPPTSPVAPLAIEEIEDVSESDFSFYPFSVGGGYLAVSKADFRTPDVEDQHLIFTQAEASFGFTMPLSTCWGLIFGTGWVNNEVNMSENPNFTETQFGYVTFSLGVFTKHYTDWIWSVMLSMSIDTERLDLGNYALYDGILWGQYTLCPFIDFTFGVIVELGINKDRAWPILGFSYAFSPDWKLNLVYPTNLSLEYKLIDCITLAGSVHFLRSRHRVGGDEPDPLSIFEYLVAGLEFDVTYSPFDWFWIKGFVGHTGNGDLKVTNSSDNHGIHYKFKGSFYAGGLAEINF